MPRPAGRNGSRQIGATPKKSASSRMVMNNDQEEHAARKQSRHALEEIHQSRAAASPMRKMKRMSQHFDSTTSSPRTPQNGTPNRQSQDRLQGRSSEKISQMENPTPMKRVPILANFEEWMKLATDNKINANNSWNFALIDYFHDMSLLKDGPGGQVNFQKASCTLDGCVKIYTSRVDSVATETGRLLSGLADSGNTEKKSKKGGEDADGDEGGVGEDDEEDEDGNRKKPKKKVNRSHEATLAPSFASLQLKNLELEFAVDPLFKKASADFDEGGAKGLLLNHLSIDSRGRIVFDSSDDAGDATTQKAENNDQTTEESNIEEPRAAEEESQEEDEEIDLGLLSNKFFPDLAVLDQKAICPSMKDFTLGSSDLTIPAVKSLDSWVDSQNAKDTRSTPQPELNLADQTGIFLDGSNGFGFDDDDDDGGLGGFEMADDIGFGEGGEAWAREGAIEPMARVVPADEDNQNDGEVDDGFAMTMQHQYREDAEQQTIMAYFDKAFNSRGKGKAAFDMSLENWRIQKIQKARRSEVAATNTTIRTRKEKEPFEIDFNAPISDNLRELIMAPAVNNSLISLPRTQLKTKGRNLLDKDDEVVDVRTMMRLWTKPKCRIGRRKGGMQVIDEGFGSRSRAVDTTGERPSTADEDQEEIEGRKGDYDANFFADDEPLPFMYDGPLPIDDDDDDDNGEPGFVDAREMLGPAPETNQQHLSADLEDSLQPPDSQDHHPPDSQFPLSQRNEMAPGSFGLQLIAQQGRRLRPEYVNYARTAKKVDVRALKENMWKGMNDKLLSSMSFSSPSSDPRPPTPALTDDADADMMDVDQENPPPPPTTTLPADGTTLKFTNMISDLRSVYPEPAMKDISTSYCFICLLHLANEKGLVLDGGREDGTMNEIVIRRDETVGEGYVGE